jgi:hypothetical protein
VGSLGPPVVESDAREPVTSADDLREGEENKDEERGEKEG